MSALTGGPTPPLLPAPSLSTLPRHRRRSLPIKRRLRLLCTSYAAAAPMPATEATSSSSADVAPMPGTEAASSSTSSSATPTPATEATSSSSASLPTPPPRRRPWRPPYLLRRDAIHGGCTASHGGPPASFTASATMPSTEAAPPPPLPLRAPRAVEATPLPPHPPRVPLPRLPPLAPRAMEAAPHLLFLCVAAGHGGRAAASSSSARAVSHGGHAAAFSSSVPPRVMKAAPPPHLPPHRRGVWRPRRLLLVLCAAVGHGDRVVPRRRLLFLRATADDERDIGKKECRVNGRERETREG
ncbi:hypothetical protein PVAP13_9NG304473 [Panicum virgatum]|uniref:Uncharacterized protein n=1 Tax=Panicum virgatum TaxID=38727 RepID=A0A8T0MJM6_PANVG|nr:hypothetical protein PVAP13_9NG304473 [Panicum virgatum]